MPISKEAFNEGLSSFEESIINFLKRDPQNAYSQSELADSLGADITTLAGAISFALTLNGLVAKRLIISKTIGGKPYYISAKAGS